MKASSQGRRVLPTRQHQKYFTKLTPSNCDFCDELLDSSLSQQRLSFLYSTRRSRQSQSHTATLTT